MRQTPNPKAERRIAMAERTVTEQQVIDAFNMAVPLDERMSLGLIFNKLFPELPKEGELVLVWDEIPEGSDWQTVISISGNEIETLSFDGEHYKSCNYRRQTPAEKGEG
jgi:hypothetical protein